MKLEYKHKTIYMYGEDVVTHKAVLFIKTNSGKTFKFKNRRILGKDLGTTMYAERRQLQDILESAEDCIFDGSWSGAITKEEWQYVSDHFDDLFYNKVLEF